MKRTKPAGWKKSPFLNKELLKQIDGIDENGHKYTLPELRKQLTDKQKAFCHEYVSNGWNATKAGLKAGYSKDSVRSLTSTMLTKQNIIQYIHYIKDDIEMLCGISKTSQIKEYQKIAYSSIRHLHNKWTEFKDWDDLVRNNPDLLDAVESIDTKTLFTKQGEEVQYIKVKLHPKVTALERIDKLMGYQEADKLNV